MHKDVKTSTQSALDLQKTQKQLKTYFAKGINGLYDQMPQSQNVAQDLIQKGGSQDLLEKKIQMIVKDAKLTAIEEERFRKVFFVTLANPPSNAKTSVVDYAKLKTELSQDFQKTLQKNFSDVQKTLLEHCARRIDMRNNIINILFFFEFKTKCLFFCF